MDTLWYEYSGRGVAEPDWDGCDHPSSEQPRQAGGQGHHDVTYQQGQAAEEGCQTAPKEIIQNSSK